jgi:hypothetical protein
MGQTGYISDYCNDSLAQRKCEHCVLAPKLESISELGSHPFISNLLYSHFDVIKFASLGTTREEFTLEHETSSLFRFLFSCAWIFSPLPYPLSALECLQPYIPVTQNPIIRQRGKEGRKGLFLICIIAVLVVQRDTWR